MKIHLKIGSASFLAPNMQTAGKVADMLNKMKPLNKDWRNHNKEVFVEARSHEHEIRVESLRDGVVIVKSVDQAMKLRDPNAKDAKTRLLI